MGRSSIVNEQQQVPQNSTPSKMADEAMRILEGLKNNRPSTPSRRQLTPTGASSISISTAKGDSKISMFSR